MRLSVKIALVLAAVGVAAGAVGSVFVYRSERRFLQGSALREQSLIVREKAQEIDDVLCQAQQDIQSVVGEIGFVEFLKSAAAPPHPGPLPPAKDSAGRGDAAAESLARNKQSGRSASPSMPKTATGGSPAAPELLASRLESLRDLSGLWSLLLVADRDGRIRLSSEPQLVGASVDDERGYRSSFDKAVRTRRVTHSDLVSVERTGERTVVFAAPIQDPTDGRGEVIGAAVGHFAWRRVLEILEAVRGPVLTLYNGQGVMIGASDPRYRDFVLRLDHKEKPVVRGALAGALDSPIQPGTRDGRPALASFARQRGAFEYDGIGWVLVAETPTASAWAAASQSAVRQAVLFLGIVLMGFAATLVLLTRQISRPIARLTSAVHKMAAGDLSSRVGAGRRDEVGELARAFDEMAANLERVTASRNDLEQETAKRKRAQGEVTLRNQVAQVLLTVADDEMYGDVLQIVLRAMDSKYGVFGYIDEHGAFVVPTMTRDIWEQCRVAGKDVVFPRERWGDSTWCRAIREKRTICQNEPSVKTPPGHIPMRRHISLPVIHRGRVIGLFQVANKDSDYDEADTQLMEVIGAIVAPVLDARLQRDRQERARQRAERELANKAEELARSNADLEQFAYVASHDLQEPLRMVAGYVGLLARRYRDKLDRDANEFIEFAVDGARRMQQLIDDLLLYSRVGRGGKAFEPVDSNIVVDEAVKNLEATISEHNGVVTRDELPTVRADRTQLAQLFQNLVSNAVKFHGQEPPRVHVRAVRSGDDWVFSVQDNGIGIDRKYRDRIFKIFQRLHTREEYPGTGIGLAVCQRIVDRHGGRIWFESEPGKGSTFCFTLPAKGACA